jgi:hypothetical protein
MAQTRACSKVLSNLFKWVAVMKGYQGTPAEEMPDGDGGGESSQQPQKKSASSGGNAQSAPAGDVISEAQAKRMFAIARGAGLSGDQYADFLKRHGYERDNQVKKSEYERLVAELEKGGKG